jgi:oxygen-independent coproporphyrinogen-3 oxidase
VPVDEFVRAVLTELRVRAPEVDPGQLSSIYLGGGTPSKLGPEGIEALLRGFAQWLDVKDFSTFPAGFELTIEANPEDVSAESAGRWATAGVRRVSLGVQSFDPAVLAWMHREHTAEQVGQAVEALRGAGIEDVSVDLIFALPETLRRDWRRDLDLALKLEPTHLSIYGLTVEPRTPLGKWMARGEVTEAPEERYEHEFLEADRLLTGAGFEHYEVSSYGKPGRRARHNSSYWSGAAYLGLGPSAHGFDGTSRRWNRAQYTDWLRVVSSGVDPIEGSEPIGPAERAAEEVYLGLRTTDGLSIRQSEMAAVAPWVEMGWAALSADRLRLTPTGWLRLDSIAAALTSLRSRS